MAKFRIDATLVFHPSSTNAAAATASRLMAQLESKLLEIEGLKMKKISFEVIPNDESKA